MKTYPHPHLGPTESVDEETLASPEHTIPFDLRCSASEVTDHPEFSSDFGGNSSITAQSAYATEFLETAVSRSGLQTVDPEIKSALATLKQIAHIHEIQRLSTAMRFPNERPIPKAGLPGLPMPPHQAVLSILRNIKVNTPLCFQLSSPFITVEYFIEKCRAVYFSTEPFSDATFIIVNGKLSHILYEYTLTTQSPDAKREFTDYYNICRCNLETALSNIRLLVPPKKESVEALLLGTVHSIDLCKPSLAWSFISAAAAVCQTLGYHRSLLKDDISASDQEASRNLFLSVYIFDKSLSLRLGRASSIRDHDISLPFNLDLNCSDPIMGMFSLWVDFAKVQDKVYTELYSPVALSQPERDRILHASRLASDMRRIIAKSSKPINQNSDEESIFQFILRQSNEISHLSTLTLIYRAIPAPDNSDSTFVADCVETARAALESHESCIAQLKKADDRIKASYTHWSIFYAPFIPFMVIFCHVIELSDSSDLHRLEDFVLSLQHLGSLSDPARRLHQLCQLLAKVARLYIDAKAQSHEDQSIALAGQEFDFYLSTLGLAHSAVPDGVDPSLRTVASQSLPLIPSSEDSLGGLSSTSRNSYLTDWFSGNQHMMGLLEEDLSILRPSMED
ncbi:uncharacterized protein N7498_006452 [Penicillium cinerascens]|uniref:Xylanolytic transcriptional activator regulatory domain-containing protein n=1 Tax=Penicillium cinerascens TaxID=70096 RepID=A0A9W9MIA0_9EURO|nr:uncharacterized protein N7498_006452 [Penicillium cinerascens]KAJ5201789.1 hypothetical protein N7498_006452 [Penicillium cinerascens]